MTTDSQPTPEQVVARALYECIDGNWTEIDSQGVMDINGFVDLRAFMPALRDAGYADPVKLPEPDRYADDEREWAFSGEHFGFVNLGIADGGVEIDIAMDTGSVDGFTTVAKGFVPLSALHPLAAALLAAADSAERGES